MTATSSVPRSTLLKLSVAADCDERTIRKVLADPSTATKSRAAARALAQLKKAGLVPATAA